MGVVWRCIAFLTNALFEQVGDGSMTNRDISVPDRLTPVAVVGLSSGVAMVSLGHVR